jgi:hypothetical protein
VDRNEILKASPSDLFAGALESRRALRKAYAELIRQYGPERDPECFRRIRDAYEVLSSHFDAPRPEASSPLADAPDHASAGSPSAAVNAVTVLEQSRSLLDAERPLDALKLLDDNEALLRAREPVAWFDLMMRSLLKVGYDVPAERITRAFDDLDDPRFEIREDTYFAIASRWTAIQAWSKARDDQQLPEVFRSALVAPYPAPRLELAERWRSVLTNLGEEGLTKAYWRVASSHPGLLPVLHEIDDAISGVVELTNEWEFGAPRVSVPPAHAAEVAILSKLHARQLKPVRKSNHQLAIGIGLAVLAMIQLLLPEDLRGTVLWIGMCGAFGLLLLWKRLNDPVRLLQRAERLEARVRRLINVSGMFRHEAVAAIVRCRTTPHVQVGHGFFAVAQLDPLTTLAEQPPLELGLLSEAHLARLRQEQFAKEQPGT